MNPMIRGERAALLVATVVLGSCANSPNARVLIGRIEGIVIYADGRPVHGATVYADPTDRGMVAKVPSATTDEQGQFWMAHLWSGEFVVTAKKEDEGYPVTGAGFYGDGRITRVRLTFTHPSATTTILLGPKAGILVGTVSDAVTGAPVDPCVDFHRASDPNDFLSGTGLVNAEYHVLVPPDRDVIMKIWHEGYLPWYYPGTNNKSEAQPLRLKSSEERTVHIRLQPGTDASDAGCNTPLCFPHCRP